MGKESAAMMSIFPTRILLATDGSEEAELAALRAVDVAQSTDSELHVVRALSVCRLAGNAAAVPPEAVLPDYLRDPDAKPQPLP